MDIKRLNKYAIIITSCIAVLFIPFFTLSNFEFLYTDVDNARYMLSALIQSEAAIISIVVTLSLVAVQLAASSYSVRVIDVFRKTPALWMLLTIYGIVIFFGLAVLRMIDLNDPYVCESTLLCQFNLERSIAYTYSLGILAYVALAAYIWEILGLLKPSAIMSLLAEDISKETIIESGKTKYSDDDYNEQNDVILPIIDIMRSALREYDYATVRAGLREIRVKIKGIFKEDIQKECEQKLADYLLDHLTRIRNIAIHNRDKYSTNEIIKTIQIIGVAAVDNKLETIAGGAISNLEDVGIEAAKQNLEWPTQNALSAIEKIRNSYVKKYYLFNWNECIENNNKELIECLTQKFSIKLTKTPNIEMDTGDKVIIIIDEGISLRLTDEMTNVYLKIGDNAPIKLTARKDNDKLNIYKKGFDMRLSGGGLGEASYLENIGITAIEHRLEDAARHVACLLGNIGCAAAENNLKYALSKSIESLDKMSECAKKEGLCDTMKEIRKNLLLIYKVPSPKFDKSKEFEEIDDAFVKVNVSIKEICNKKDE